MPYADPERYRQYQKEYRERERDRLQEYDRQRKRESNLTSDEVTKKRERWRAYYANNRKRLQGDYRVRSFHWRAKLRKEVLQAYGGLVPFCRCCGETAWEFLSLDHINGGGATHRREIGDLSANSMYLWAKRNGYPPIFQVLCHNCNQAKGFYGRCPHQGYTG